MSKAVIENRITELEERLVAIESFIQNPLMLIVPPKVLTKSERRKRADARKVELLKKVPYSKKNLEGMSTRDLHMLSAALNVGAFAIPRKTIISNVLKAQKAQKSKK